MGLLSEGRPLSWEETKRYADHVRVHGIQQIIHQFHRLKNRAGDNLLWGDEVEYCILKRDDVNCAIRVSLRGKELLDVLTVKERHAKPDDELQALWRPEYGAYMIEGTPGVPYGGLMAHFNIVEVGLRRLHRPASDTYAKLGQLPVAVFSRRGHLPGAPTVRHSHQEHPVSTRGESGYKLTKLVSSMLKKPTCCLIAFNATNEDNQNSHALGFRSAAVTPGQALLAALQ